MMKLEPVKTVGQFLDHVSRLRKEWENALWFRGEKRDFEHTRLRPGLFRPYEDKPLKLISELIEIEDELFAQFRHCSTVFARAEASGEDLSDAWTEYYQMQHHEAPTRLLDWSDGALIALHFAIRTDELKEEKELKPPIVYVMDPDWLTEYIDNDSDNFKSAKENWSSYCRNHPTAGLDEDDWETCFLPLPDGHEELPIPLFPLVLDFDHFSRRISAQRSRFILMGSDPSYLQSVFERPDARIETIEIDASSVSDMRIALRDAGITESVIYPDLDGLGREIKQLWAEKLRA